MSNYRLSHTKQSPLPYKHRPLFWTKIRESNYNAINTPPLLFQIKKSLNTLKSNDSEKNKNFSQNPLNTSSCFFDLQIVRGGGAFSLKGTVIQNAPLSIKKKPIYR